LCGGDIYFPGGDSYFRLRHEFLSGRNKYLCRRENQEKNSAAFWLTALRFTAKRTGVTESVAEIMIPFSAIKPADNSGSKSLYGLFS